MPKNGLIDSIKNPLCIPDGAFGTPLQTRLKPRTRLDLANLQNPEPVKKAHPEYIDAGADVLSTSLLGANAVKLRACVLESSIREINFRAVRSARTAAGDRAFAAVTIGPAGPLSFAEAVETFRQQASAPAHGGVDCILLETFSGFREIRAVSPAGSAGPSRTPARGLRGGGERQPGRRRAAGPAGARSGTRRAGDQRRGAHSRPPGGRGDVRVKGDLPAPEGPVRRGVAEG
jgi:hypothetical protein